MRPVLKHLKDVKLAEVNPESAYRVDLRLGLNLDQRQVVAERARPSRSVQLRHLQGHRALPRQGRPRRSRLALDRRALVLQAHGPQVPVPQVRDLRGLHRRVAAVAVVSLISSPMMDMAHVKS